MEEVKEKQNLAEIARKKRYLHLIEKMHSGKPLSKPEIRELEEFESEPLEATVVKTMEEVGKVMDVSERTVQRWKKDGMPVTAEGYYDLDAIKAWHDGRGIVDGEETEGKAYWDEKIRKYRATLLELDLKKATGELVSREEVERGRIARIIAVKRSFLALPTRLAPVLAMKEPREIETLLYEAVAEIIDDFAGGADVNKKTGQNNMDANGTAGVETT
jgi:phage terminase Nu1 subunit (DNA packaging protein)